jgi:hypothetical protein
MIIRRFLGVLLVSLSTLLGACQPYIYEPDEFNRERADFGRERTDRTEVSICYFTRTTTPQDILAMAEGECAKFGKTARYLYSQTGECPLSTPTLGHFACTAR